MADLAGRGLVERSQAAEDGRGVTVSITPVGLEKFKAVQDPSRQLGAALVLAVDGNRDPSTGRHHRQDPQGFLLTASIEAIRLGLAAIALAMNPESRPRLLI
ncbi:MAG: hypothetical protein ABR609_08970 [Acidimicrobiia bacterium]